jgi:trk system potassium uptake protein TrkH
MRLLLFIRGLVFPLGFAAMGMTLALVMALIRGETGMIRALGIPVGIVLALAPLAAIPVRKKAVPFGPGGSFLPVFSTWIGVCLLGAAPYYISGHIGTFSGAFFESVSGFTATGATLIPDREILPRSLLFWRAMTQWLGSMAIVVYLAVLLPGAGGIQPAKAEIPDPGKNRIVPGVGAGAKFIWFLYMGLTGAELLLLKIVGMDWFDAAVHALSTISSGGFSSRNGGIAAYGSPWIHWIIILFMFLAGFNFTLLYRLLRGKYREVLDNSEARAYGLIVLVCGGISFLSLLPRGAPAEETLRQALFHTVSIISTTGYTLGDPGLWPPLAQGVLFFLLFSGGCSLSTAGGIKVGRHLILLKQGKNELMRILYPRGVFAIRMNRKAGRKDAVYGVAGFVFLYLVLVFAAAFLVSTAGFDLFSSLNAGLLILGNTGLGLGTFGGRPPLPALPAYVKWGLSFIMIAGRLELWTVLVFFSRDYWRR